jgi:hypothetical protein
MLMASATVEAVRPPEVRHDVATVTELHRWLPERDAEARGRSMAAHPAGLRRRRPDQVPSR